MHQNISTHSNTKIIDDKYTGLDTTNTRYKYFSGDYDKKPVLGSAYWDSARCIQK